MEDLEKNSEIQEALSEFEAKNAEQEIKSQPISGQRPDSPKMTGLVIKYSGGLVKTQEQAEYTLLGFVILAAAASLLLFLGGNEEANIKAPPGQRIIYPPDEPPRLERQF